MSYKPGDVLKGKYAIQEVLGQGSMGEVYRAEHVSIHRQFAIKLMHVHIAETTDALVRFRREASAAAQLDHPHICQVTDFDSTENGDFYLVMEYLKGETLRDRLKRNGTIELHSIFRIMDDLLCALECAHESGIVHRDVKPENISLINRDERDDYVKLIDFGIAHADKPDDNKGTLTQLGQVYGTPQYLPPEQVMGNPVDLRADLYSCGCTLYEMIEGIPPFEAENYILLLNKHLVLDPPHLSKDYDCIADLDAVIQKLLMKHPEDRYSNAREVRKALAEIAHRFDPSLGQYVSQHGSQSPASTFTDHTPQTNQGAKPSQTASTISNPYINPDEISLLEPLKPRASAPDLSECAVKCDEQAQKNKIMIIGIVSAIAAIVILVVVLLLVVFSQPNPPTETAQPAPAQPAPVQTPPEDGIEPDKSDEPSPKKAPKFSRQKANSLEQPQIEISDTEIISELSSDGYVLTDEQIREFAAQECHISETDPLYQDESMRAAAENCAQGNFEESYKYFDKSKNKYRDSNRFFIMSMINSYAIKRYRDTIRDALQLIIIDPAAVCTPSVREIIYSLYEDDDTYVRLRIGILNLFDQPGASESLSWLLLSTPCNQYKKRFERLSDSIKVATRSFEEDFNESWLGVAVNLWDKFDSKSKCSVKKNIDKLIYNELNPICSDPENASSTSTRCTACYPIWEKRYKESNKPN